MLLAKWRAQETSNHPRGESYLQFRRRARPGPGGCIMIEWLGMWLGIEKDGYPHT